MEDRAPVGLHGVYKKSSGPGINGGGERYHVLDCTGAENMLGFVQWQGEKTIKDVSYPILDVLEVEDEDCPPSGAYFYYSCKKQDGATLLLLYSSENARLYALEEFF
ncbi:MAG: hypothetical protein ABFC62_03705 [Clostridiaceae bacterium]